MDRTRRLLNLFTFTLIAAAAFAAFQVTSPGGFLSDDFSLLHGAMSITASSLWDKVIVPDTSWGFYRPMGLLYWWLCFKLFGTVPFGYWILAVLNHALNGFLIFLIVRRLGLGYQGALAAGLVFVAFPLHGEAVAWLSGGFDRLCLLFMLSSLYAYLRFREEGLRTAYIISLVFFVTALLSKEMAVTSAALVFAVDAVIDWKGLRGLKDALTRALPFFIITAAYFALRFAVFHGLGGYSDTQGSSLHTKLDFAVILSNLTKLPALLLFPLNTVLLRDPVAVVICISAVYLLSAAARVYFGGPSARFALLGLLWLGIAYMPVMTLYLAFPDLLGGRFSYVPSAGLALFAAFVFGRPTKPGEAGIAVKTGLLVALLGCYIYACQINYSSWPVAYDLARFIPREAAKLVSNPPPGARMYFSGKFDNLAGAYIYRNGLEDAVNITYGRDGSKRVKVGFIDKDGKVKGDPSLDIASLTSSPRSDLFIFRFDNEESALLKVYPGNSM